MVCCCRPADRFNKGEAKVQLGGKGGAVDYLPPWKTLIFNNPEKSIQSLCSVQPNIYNKNAIANAHFF